LLVAGIDDQHIFAVDDNIKGEWDFATNHELRTINQTEEVIEMVFKKTISIMTLFCFAMCLQGCYSLREIKSEQLRHHPRFTIAKVVTTDGEVVEFKTKKRNIAIITADKIQGSLKDGTPKTVPLSQVKSVYITEFDKNRTFSWVIGSSFAVALVVSIIASTTPPIGSGGSPDEDGC
jgi:hypothetical protein